ncbi:DNA-processing protein DprA [Sulfurimonas marina]|uniref:DNA-processing protein DprA n=1 Tax=Sulfurimonas marina TaxID=2590551 RepID=A0A7M1AWP7_9BACT|nr:DNA-processing protein DprA [Sulfurimonas marina]QOP41850.1 DNA-processing protein DprA [Sulfurimonas marina]
MIKRIDFQIDSLKAMKKYPENLYYKGNVELLQSKMISVVGSRKPNQYARNLTQELCSKLALRDIKIVSGGAIGIDAIAHKSAGAANTIMVAGTGLDVRYPAVNKNLIQEIENKGLVLSQFAEGEPSRRYTFPLRNELIVALSDILIVAYADLNSGTMRSVEYALKMQKEVYVFPHRIGESAGSSKLLQEGNAKLIYDIDEFAQQFGTIEKNEIDKDEFLLFCKTNPSYEEAMKKDASKLFEYELLGKIEVKDSKVYIKHL